ncbi:hypothetical protein L3X38_043715 [Prunus dulcis]|uniref:NB-ARC domain-containing protein n=1 Tax=Prunus dulcis TaxID=3755 RepID=A0AAD4UYM3_PRUDU|nr:hypothetical protein L3X38_043715 [Prunus dulcis]
MNDLLGVGVADVRMVGICGTGGMGKTTLAKAVYNSVAHKFEGSCFLGKVREKSQLRGLVKLQKTLLHDILRVKISSLTNADLGVDIIRRRLGHKRVLLIIDDVDQLKQLEYLAGSSDWFGVGSRIIITTRDQHLLHAHGVEFTYQVKELESDEALELFSSNAFPTSRLPDDYQELARRFVGYAQGNPLALTATGSLLYRKSIAEWHSILERYERAPASNIHEILKITKKELDHHIKRPKENVLITNVEDHAGGLNEAESNELMLEQNDTISGTPEVERLQGKISETYNEVTGLNEVENTAKLLVVETFSSTQEEERIQGHINRTDDVTEQNEDENNVNSVEGEKTFSSIQEEDLLGKTPGTDDALHKAETTEELVEGDETFSSTQEEDRLQGKIQGTDDVTEPNEAESTSTQVVETVEGKFVGTEDVTEQNEDKNNVNSVEGDKTFSSIQEEDLLGKTPGTDDALHKAETIEELVEGDETFSSTQEEDRLQGKIQGTDDVTEPNEAESTSTQVVETVEGKFVGTEDVTEQNEDENNVNLVEGDKTFSSIQEEDLLGKTPGTDDELHKAETTEELVEGDETFSSTQDEYRLQGTDDVTVSRRILSNPII